MRHAHIPHDGFTGLFAAYLTLCRVCDLKPREWRGGNGVHLIGKRDRDGEVTLLVVEVLKRGRLALELSVADVLSRGGGVVFRLPRYGETHLGYGNRLIGVGEDWGVWRV